MKMIKLLLAAGIGIIACNTAFAGHYHGFYRPGVRFGVYINPFPLISYRSYYGGPYYSPYYSSYYPATVLAPEVIPAPAVIYRSSPTYVTEVPANPSYTTNEIQSVPASGSSDWLYCSNPDGFYPAIKDCPGGWRKVPAQSR